MDARATLYSRVGIITGLDFEARVIIRAAPSAKTDTHFQAIATGASSEGIENAVTRLIDEGAEALVSFGLCGALSTVLNCGDVVLASAVHTTDDRFKLDYGMRNRIAAGLDDQVPIAEGPIGTSRRILMLPDEKSQEFRETGAIAVDMESGYICRAAASAGIPCAVVRVVADTAADRIPGCAAEGFGPDGGIRIGAVLRTLLSHPGQLFDLLRFSNRVWRARRRLRSVAGPLLFLLARM